MYLGSLCYGYALKCHLAYLAIPGTRPLCMKNQNLFVLFICNLKREIQICSNKHETGLVPIPLITQDTVASKWQNSSYKCTMT